MPAHTLCSPSFTRRAFLRASGALGLCCLGGGLVARAQGGCGTAIGSLQAPDTNGLMLPAGFTSRVVATSDQTVPGTSHVWHRAPDGGATFARPGGGWVYVSNAELGSTGVATGGAGALAFDADGTLSDAYTILSGTRRNCAGGPTPWGTWLSCEELPDGLVYECDPFSPGAAGQARPALGSFAHEAAAVDPAGGRVYLTEDQPDGLLYRFTPSAYPDLSAGALEAAEILDPEFDGPIAPGEVRPLAWHPVPIPNPGASDPTTRQQATAATVFRGGEGCWHHAGRVYFATKHDNRVWSLDTSADTIEILYDFASSSDPDLTGVDNVTVAPCGDVYVAEDGGNFEVVALGANGSVDPIARLTGVIGTEITGPAFSPDGRRLYFSSQRNPGVTFEVSGPFDPQPVPVPSSQGAGRSLLWGTLGAIALASLRRPIGR